MTEYRIKRTDTKNIAIQRSVVTKGEDTKWKTISYHGHSLNSLISGLAELIMSNYTPDDEKLLDALETLRLELVSSLDKIRKIIKEHIIQ